MTAVAAILLVMLVTRWQLQSPGQRASRALRPPRHPSPNSRQVRLAAENGSGPEYWLATGVRRALRCSRHEEMSYLTLRDQVLRDGVESWKLPVSAVAATAGERCGGTAASYREQLNRLLEQQGLRS